MNYGQHNQLEAEGANLAKVFTILKKHIHILIKMLWSLAVKILLLMLHWN